MQRAQQWSYCNTHLGERGQDGKSLPPLEVYTFEWTDELRWLEEKVTSSSDHP